MEAYTKLREYIRHYVDLTPDEWQYISGFFKPKEISKGELYLKSGQICNELCFITRGALRMFFIDIKGDEKTGWLVFENQLISELMSFFSRQPTKEYLEALEDCCLLVISYSDLQRLYREVPKFEQFGRMYVETSFVGLKATWLAVFHETAKDRYLKLLESQPQVFNRVPLKYIASYIGVTDTSLSRIRRQIRDAR